MPTSSARARTCAWLAVAALGAVLVALPDDDERVVSLSATHGPSAVDLIGVVLLVAAWVPLPLAVWRSRRSVPRRAWIAAAVVASLAAVSLVVTVRRDLGWWWLAAAAALTAAQALPLAARGR